MRDIGAPGGNWAVLIVLLFFLSIPVQADGFSLRFYGNGVNDIDRVKIQIDDPANNDPGPPADVGAEDFTLEFWMKASAAENTAAAITCGGYNWIYGNIVFDRDRFNQDPGYGIAIAGGVIVFGLDVYNGSYVEPRTICGSTNVLDNQWHHVAVQRRRADGWMWLYVDGQLELQVDGPDGDLSYPDDGVPGNYCGGPCTNSDPYLVIGAEKHDAGSSYPSYSGWIDEIRLSNVIRYSSNFSPSTIPFGTDPNVVALYHLDEGSGDVINDLSGALGGPSNGVRKYGGTPAGPGWSGDTPFAGVLGDLNNDGRADSLDLGILMSRWGSNDPAADLNASGVVDSADLAILLSSTVLTHGAMVGHTTSSSVKLWSRADKSSSYQIEYSINPDLSDSALSPPVQLDLSTDYTGVIDIGGLNPETRYYYSVILNGGRKNSSPYPSFRTFPLEDTPVNFSFLFGSCQRAPLTSVNLGKIYASMKNKNPAFMVHQGDLIYADKSTGSFGIATNLNDFREKYKEAYDVTEVRNFSQEVAMYTQWDDHEITNNWGGKSEPLYAFGSQASAEYQYAHMPGNGNDVDGDKVRFYTFTYGNVDFFILDTRSYRASGTMLGAVQKAWLKNALSNSNAKFKIISSSVGMNDFGTTGADDWSGYTAERDELLDYIGSNSILGVLLISGDKHTSSYVRIVQTPFGYDDVYEYSVSPIESSVRSINGANDPNLIWEGTGNNVFGMITVDTASSPATLTLEAYDLNGALVSGSQFVLTEYDINPMLGRTKRVGRLTAVPPNEPF